MKELWAKSQAFKHCPVKVLNFKGKEVLSRQRTARHPSQEAQVRLSLSTVTLHPRQMFSWV